MLRIYLLAAFILFSQATWATLGERKNINAETQQKVSGFSQYQVIETKVDATTVREYVNADGFVFAIAWNGLSHPDLSLYLGKYFSEYDSLVKDSARPAGRAPMTIKTSSLVLTKKGHMRDVRGSAYDPDLLPLDFDLGELK